MAEEWISRHVEEYERGISLTLAITDKKGKYLIGAIGLAINKGHDRAELVYWVEDPIGTKDTVQKQLRHYVIMD